MMRTVRLSVIPLCVLLGLIVSGLSAAEERPAERVSLVPKVNPNAVVWRTSEPPKEPQAGDIWINPKDGMEMIYIAPGKFTLGMSKSDIRIWTWRYPNDKREEFKDQQPQCQVNLPGYWIGRTEVTNAQYLRFVHATGHRAPEYCKDGQIPAGMENMPVEFVTWEDANAYCKWAGLRLPTELEWEKAARGNDGRLFPWGNRWDRTKCRNFSLITSTEFPSFEASFAATTEWGKTHDEVRDGPTAPGTCPDDTSPWGCLDMAGNVSEWCEDWYDSGAYVHYAKGNLAYPSSGQRKVVRGGPWSVGIPKYFLTTWRRSYPPNYIYGGYGFRCAR